MLRARFIFVMFVGCLPGLVGNPQRTVTAVEIRAGVIGIDANRLDPKVRQALEAGQVWPGETETELYLARGQPHVWWNTKVGQNSCREFVHHGADAANADLAVTTCGGRVIQAKQINPPLPCWRLAEVGPRIQKALDYFEGRSLETQWQIVIGLMHRGQAEQDVVIAFGDPHNRGFDEREDGKHAEKLVFLDHSGDAYGLSVTLIDNKVVQWAMPAERALTPEAQQRRLEAMEKRLNEKIAALERLQIQQHEETVKLFGDVMSKQDSMMSELTTIENQQAAQPGGGGGGGNTYTGPSDSITTPDGGGGGGGGQQPITKQPKDPPIVLPAAKTCSCPEIPCNDHFNAIKVQYCSARCIGNTEPACSCNGKCVRTGSGNALTISQTPHKCGCT